MEKIKQRFNVNSFFVLLAILFSFLLNGLKNEWYFLLFSILSFIFFAYKKVKIEINDIWFFYFISLFIAAFFSHSSIISFFVVFKWCVFWLFYRYVAENTDTEFSFIIAIVLVSFVSSFVMGIKFFFFNLPLFGFITGNVNYTSVFFVLSALYFLICSLNSSKIKIFLLNLAITVYFLFFIFLINSRGALLSFFISAFLMLFFLKGKRIATWGVLIVLLFVCILPYNLIFDLFKIQDVKSYARIDLWKTALKGFLEYPVFGYGPGLFENIFSIFKFRNFDGITFFNHTTIHAHSEILNILSESGVVATVFYLLACLYSLYYAENRVSKFFLLAIFIQSSCDIVLYLPLLNLIFMMAAGYSIKKSFGSLNFSATAVVFMFLALISVFPYFSYKMKMGRDWGLNKISDEVLRQEIENSYPNSARILALSSYATHYYPLSVYFLFEKAKCLKLSGNYKEALENLKRAIFIEPFFNKAHLMAAEIYLNTNDKKNALNALKNIKFYKDGKNYSGAYAFYLLEFDAKTYETLKKRLFK